MTGQPTLAQPRLYLSELGLKAVKARLSDDEVRWLDLMVKTGQIEVVR